MKETNKSEDINSHYLYMRPDKRSSGYRVGVAKIQPNGYVGYPIDERQYISEKQAKNRYDSLRKQIRTW